MPYVSYLKRGALYMERTFWAVGLLLLIGCSVYFGQMFLARGAAAQIAPQAAVNSASSDMSAASTAIPASVSSGPAVVGRIEIPALHLSTPLLAGDDSMSLTQGAGHIPGTAFPGGLGTVGIAGHRDTHFRELSHVAKGMDIRLIDHTKTYHYQVTTIEIVTPEQVSVLDILSEPGLALVTCYPFSYLGHAPKRFIVHATLVSAAPDE